MELGHRLRLCGRCGDVYKRQEQLFRCQVIPPEQVAEHRAGAVQGGTLIGIEQEDEQVVQQLSLIHISPEYPTGYILALGVGNYYDLPDADFFSVETTFIDVYKRQQYHRCGGGRPAGAGLHQNHRLEGLSGSGVIPA